MASVLGLRFISLGGRALNTASRSFPRQGWRANGNVDKLIHTLKQEAVIISHKNALTNSPATKMGTVCRNLCYSSGQGVRVFTHIGKKGNSLLFVRYSSGQRVNPALDKKDIVMYIMSIVIFSGGLAYAGVPFFKLFCKQFGFGGNPDISKGHDKSKVATMNRVDDRVIKVNFEADRHTAMRWNFQPQQRDITIKPGETALAFYTAENPTDKPIIGISTYTVTPYKAAPYFNKIQCFCFEEQILNPHEKVDMPVFFYIDPDFDEDPNLEFEDEITLAYTFFEAKEGMSLPLPGFMTNKA